MNQKGADSKYLLTRKKKKLMNEAKTFPPGLFISRAFCYSQCLFPSF